VKRIAYLILVIAVPFPSGAKEKPRPKILGIAQVRILTTNETAANTFYHGLMRELVQTGMGEQACSGCEDVPNLGADRIGLDPVEGSLPYNLIGAVAFKTDNAEELRHILKRNEVPVGKLTKSPSGTSFGVLDPEGHKLIFIQTTDSGAHSTGPMGIPGASAAASPPWPQVIHAGFVVKDRAAMDRFYRDLLGFHVYWTGGMKDGETDWVDMQVPDGRDWIEYMLNVPQNADKQTLGVMNHIALGVPDVRATAKQLQAKGMKLPEPPQIGRDGKWQLNLYDPDDTRVELMEFTPVEKPCCAEYTGPHPQP
jgi:catechol 2,3-dioxygenase-like lactoylglutathione lyase family enzyme